MTNLAVLNEKILVEKLKKNDIEAFDLLFKKFSNKLFRFAFSLLKNEEDAKEIVQETFIKIWEKRAGIDSSKSFKSYFFTISYNLIIDHLRIRLKDQKFRESLGAYFENQIEFQAEKIDYDILKNEINEAIEKLPERRKQLYLLSRESGLSHKEIARKLGITPKTVENQIGLALKQIKNYLKKDIILVQLFLILFS